MNAKDANRAAAVAGFPRVDITTANRNEPDPNRPVCSNQNRKG